MQIAARQPNELSRTIISAARIDTLFHAWGPSL